MQEWDPKAGDELGNGHDEAIADVVPGVRPAGRATAASRARTRGNVAWASRASEMPLPSSSRAARSVELDHGHVVIAAISTVHQHLQPLP